MCRHFIVAVCNSFDRTVRVAVYVKTGLAFKTSYKYIVFFGEM